jgi:hypothetical protein
MRAVVVLALAGCASNAPVPTQAAAGPPAVLEAQRGGADDVVVATVAGKPVWGSCVTEQAARGATRQAALEQCVDFELLAQAAAARGLYRDPEVVEATRAALVNELVAHDYEDKFTTPAEFGPTWDAIVQRGKLIFRYQHEEYRASAYVRLTLPEKVPPEEDAAAHAVADRIAAAAAPEVGLTGAELVELAQRIAGPRKIDSQEVPLYKIGALEDHYGDALLRSRRSVGPRPRSARSGAGT